jgi:UDP-3-O-[3-hydroxymyristoyl] glucosamine N-acyltransferase
VFNDARYRPILADTRAGAIVTSHDLARQVRDDSCLLLAAEPRLAYAQIGHLFYPAAALDPGVASDARIDPSARIGSGSRIDAGAIIGPDVEIGARCHIAANVVLGAGVVLGDDCRIAANTSIGYALIGARVEIATGVSIGGQGFGFVPGPKGLVRVLQLGRVIIEDDVEIGANTTIDRGATRDTVIGAGTMIDNLVQIGHNVQIGRGCVLVSQVGISGSTRLGDRVMIGGQGGLIGHLTIGSGARIGAQAGVMRDVAPGETVLGAPALPMKEFFRQVAALQRLAKKKGD